MTRAPAKATAADLTVGDKFLIPHGTMNVPVLVTEIVDSDPGQPRMIFVAPPTSQANTARMQYLLDWHQAVDRWPGRRRAPKRDVAQSSLRPRQREGYRSLAHKRV